MPRPDERKPKPGGPGGFAWSIALISLVLPWGGALFGVAGIARILRGQSDGWLLVGIGIALLILDLLIDLVWAHPHISPSQEPTLNARARQLVGRIAVVEDAISCGRGKARLGDTLWMVEGPDLVAGTRVRVTGVSGTVLRVEAE